MEEEAHAGSSSANKSEQQNADPDDSLLGGLATLCQVRSGQHYSLLLWLRTKGAGCHAKPTTGKALTGLLGGVLAGVQGARVAEVVATLLEVGGHDGITLGKERHLCDCQRWWTSWLEGWVVPSSASVGGTA